MCFLMTLVHHIKKQKRKQQKQAKSNAISKKTQETTENFEISLIWETLGGRPAHANSINDDDNDKDNNDKTIATTIVT